MVCRFLFFFFFFFFLGGGGWGFGVSGQFFVVFKSKWITLGPVVVSFFFFFFFFVVEAVCVFVCMCLCKKQTKQQQPNHLFHPDGQQGRENAKIFQKW